MITVNESARDEVLKLLNAEGHPEGSFVRVGVKGGGCSGLMYEMTFDHEMQDGDQTFEDKGVKIVVDRKSYLYLVGTELQFSGGLNGKGFQFYNPNANRTCGCGEAASDAPLGYYLAYSSRQDLRRPSCVDWLAFLLVRAAACLSAAPMTHCLREQTEVRASAETAARCRRSMHGVPPTALLADG